MLHTVCHAEVPPAAWFVMTTLTSAGVMKMPSRLEADALHTAAGTLPLAMDVNAIWAPHALESVGHILDLLLASSKVSARRWANTASTTPPQVS